MSSAEKLVFGSTADWLAGHYTRSQYIKTGGQHIGQCVTGVYSLTVTHDFCEFISHDLCNMLRIFETFTHK